MTTELIHVERLYRRGVSFLVRDKPVLHRKNEPDLVPRRVTVSTSRTAEHEPWSLTWVTVQGPRVLKGGRLGQDVKHVYSDTQVAAETPVWVVELVNVALADAEKERTGAHRPTHEGMTDRIAALEAAIRHEIDDLAQAAASTEQDSSWARWARARHEALVVELRG